MTGALGPALVLAEIGVFCLAAFALARRSAPGLADAAATAIVLTLALLSGLIQALFLAGVPALLPLAEAALGIGAAWLLVRERSALRREASRGREFIRQHPWTSGLLSAIGAYLFLQVLLLPPGNSDSMSYNLVRVLLFRQEGTLFLDRYTDPHQVFQPVGYDILSHLFLRFGTDYVVALFSFLAYLAIVLGTYAFARRHAGAITALAAALVVASLPELVFQATSTKGDLAAAAAAVASLLAAGRLWRRPSGRDLALLLVILSFGVSAKTTFAAFALPFAGVFGVVLARRHGLGDWARAIRAQPWTVGLALVPTGILSQIWLFARNRRASGTWFGPPDWVGLHQNGDGPIGALANLNRYLLESAHFLRPIEPLVARVSGRSATEWLTAGYDRWLAPFWGDAGTTEWEFSISWLPHEDISWFGPLGFVIVLPALAFAALRGPRLLRLTAAALAAYAVIVAWQVAWMPWNGRFFSLFFGSSGAAVAFLFERWGRRKGARVLVQLLAALILLYACFFNRQKPLLRHFYASWPEQLATESIWARSEWGRDRLYYADRYFGDDRVTEVSRSIPPDATVALVATRSWVYPFLLQRPDVRFVLFRPEHLEGAAELLSDFGVDHVLCLEADCERMPPAVGSEFLWHAEPGSGRSGGLLVATSR